MTDYVREFTGPYRFLSNFYIEPDGTHIEGEYQAHKLDPPLPGLLQNVSPTQAKAIGRRWDRGGKTRPDWQEVNLAIMHRLVRQKFLDHPDLRRLLIDTGQAYLEEGNWWNDTFWGTFDGIGHNHLGRILMRVREELM